MNQCSLVDKIAGLLDVLFSWKFYVPLSRLTYSIYLIHMIIIQSHVTSAMTPGYLSDYNMVSTTTVAFCSQIRTAVQVMTRQSKPCLSTQLQSLRQSKSRCLHVRGPSSTATQVLRLTPISVWTPMLRTPIENTQRRRYLNSAVHTVVK
jgi:hypothetical protein